MQLLKRLSAALALLAAIMSPAAATPPDIIDIRDELFGASLNEIFVLRTVADNQGSYTNTVGTVFLVAIDAKTAEETLWPVHRSRLQPAAEAVPGGPELEVLTEQLKGPRNPFDILTERGAAPAAALSLFTHASSQNASFSSDGIVIQHQDGSQYALPAQQLFAGLESVSTRLVEQLEPLGRMSMLGIGDLLEGQAFTPDDCSVGEPRQILFPADVPAIQIARISCGELENDFRLSVLVVVPQLRRE